MKRTMMMMAALLLPSLAAAGHDDDGDDDDDREEHHERRDARPTDVALRTTPQWKRYETECGSCHLAFPPRLLPAKSWKALLGDLSNHFDANAEVDAATRQALETWLMANAGADVPGRPLRITELSWWQREHDEIPPTTYARKAITSAANCSACHPRANQGAFGEHEVRIPRDAPPPR